MVNVCTLILRLSKSHIFNAPRCKLKCCALSLNVLRINIGPYVWRLEVVGTQPGVRLSQHTSSTWARWSSKLFVHMCTVCYVPQSSALRSKSPCLMDTMYSLYMYPSISLLEWLSPLHSKEGLESSMSEAKGMWGLDTLSLTPTSHPASKTTTRRSLPASRAQHCQETQCI